MPRGRRNPRSLDKEQDNQKNDDPPTQESPAKKEEQSSRPKRNTRASTLFNSEDYDVQIPGQTRTTREPAPTLVPVTPSSKSRRKAPVAPVEEEQESEKDIQNPTVNEPVEQDITSQDVVDSTQEQSSSAVEPISERRGTRKRRVPVRLALPEEETKDIVKMPSLNEQGHFGDYIDGSKLVVGEDIEIPHEDDGPPVLGVSAVIDNEENPIGDDSSDDEEAPDLEMNEPTKRRGRPKKFGPQHDQDNPRETYRLKIPRPAPKVHRMAPSEKKLMAVTNQKNVKVFKNELEVAPNGEPCAVVIGGCLAELLRKERVLEILTNPEEAEAIREGGWMLDKQPRLPPLTGEKVCYAFYVDGSKVMFPKDISQDDLRPWSSTNEQSGVNSIKPNVRRHPVARVGGKLAPCKVDLRLADLYLTEYSARLPRDLRLRKKIFYLMKDNKVIGNVLIIYDYSAPGHPPSPLAVPHGNDYLRNTVGDGIDETFDNDTPFEHNLIEGIRGGLYLKLRPSKSGWIQNKKVLLDYLVNKPDLLCTEDGTLLNNCLPDLPPLIETTGVFVYFVPANCVINQIHHAPDGLSPWTTNPSDNSRPQPRVRSTRRDLYQDDDGQFILGQNPRHRGDLSLVETMSTLARCRRIRKRVFYVQQINSTIVGNVCYVYEFLEEGPLPEIFAPMDLKNYHADPKYVHHTKAAIEMHPQLLDDPFDGMEIQDVPEGAIIDELMDIDGNIQQTAMYEGEEQLVEFNGEIMEDTLNGGFDDEFNDEELNKAEIMEPWFDDARMLESGHMYLTARHKKIACSFDNVLDWIVNSNKVERRGILNNTKPPHPPIVSNARAYAFFVSGSAIFPHDVNRDDFSPWSHNGNAENPTCYRTKVRKLGVESDPHGSLFQIKDGDYKCRPFHLVYLYSINPREPRLRKKIYYIMETQSKMIVSHAMIVYDYHTEGDLPRTNVGNMKAFSRRNVKPHNHHDVYNDVSDISESEKDSPFQQTFGIMEDGTLYSQVMDLDFWNDRNRQLNYLINCPTLVKQTMQVLNDKVPMMPPHCEEKGMFAFFVDLEEVGVRALTNDSLGPWSENNHSSHGTSKRPKSYKLPLSLNRNNQLRIWRTSGVTGDQISYQLHVYMATLPRCTRLRKKIVYVQKQGNPCGYALILYSFTETGKMPIAIHRERISDEETIEQLGPDKCSYIMDLMESMGTNEIINHFARVHKITITPHIIDILRERNIRAYNEAVRGTEWTGADGSQPTSSTVDLQGPLMTEEEIVVEHTEIIAPGGEAYEEVPRPNPFLEKTTGGIGYVRGSHRNEAFWRIAQKQFGAETNDETFALLFKMLHEKNENRLIQNINNTFNVDLIATDVQYVEGPIERMEALEAQQHPLHKDTLEPVDKNGQAMQE